MARYSKKRIKANGKPVAAMDLYGGLPLSTRTTFNAVTHALSQTALTDSSGQSMNLTALDWAKQDQAWKVVAYLVVTP